MITIINITDKWTIMQSARKILRALPHWFGIPASIDEYVKTCPNYPFFCCYDHNRPIGFISIKPHFEKSAEIYVMGVLEDYHRQGIGRRLVICCEAYCRDHGIGYLQVKTLDASHPDPYYAKTRAFYLAMGFCEVECFPNLWDKNNPCVLMIKAL